MSERVEQQIRAIKRQYIRLKRPIVFDRIDPNRDPVGLRIGVKALQFPHEEIINDILGFAGSVWHFKEYLKDSAPTPQQRDLVEPFAGNSIELKTCADLANTSKHATLTKPRSHLNPKLGVMTEHGPGFGIVSFDTSQQNEIEFACNGMNKQSKIWAQDATPVPFRTDVIVADRGNVVSRGDAVEFIYRAFEQWRTLLPAIGIQVRKDCVT